MYCLRCGKDTPGHQVFCDSCLQNMESCPVEPGTPVKLPPQKAPVVAKKGAKRRKPLTPEEQLARYQKLTRRLTFAVVILTALTLITAALLIRSTNLQADPPLGKNYTIDTTA